MFFLGWYLGWAAIGQILTEYPPFFWMDREAMGKTEIVAAYAVGFISMGPAGKSSPACRGRDPLRDLRWDFHIANSASSILFRVWSHWNA